MSTPNISKSSEDAWKCLREAVYNELKKKALLGQYAIIHRDGKACRVPAQQALQIVKIPDTQT